MNKEYCENIVNNWVKELKPLYDFANTQPQAAYAAYTKGYMFKFTYFLRTIENFEQFVTLVDQVISESFMSILFS